MYKTPGVSIEETAKLPASIAEVSTAIPAFIGYTQISNRSNDGTITPVRITSLLDYVSIFGVANPVPVYVQVHDTMDGTTVIDRKINCYPDPVINTMYYNMQMYFANGGGPCYIVSVGTAMHSLSKPDLLAGLEAIKYYDEPTLLVFPEGGYLTSYSWNDAQWVYSSPEYYQLEQQIGTKWDEYFVVSDLYNSAATEEERAALQEQMNVIQLEVAGLYTEMDALTLSALAVSASEIYTAALQQCADLGDRFLIMDCISNNPGMMRSGLDTDNLKYGAAYYPGIETAISCLFDDMAINVGIALQNTLGNDISYGYYSSMEDMLYGGLPEPFTLYNDIKKELAKLHVTVAPSSTIAAIYASVDRTRGVWKAPANVSLNMVKSLSQAISDEDQEGLNVDVVAGKSINAIRSFAGKGNLVWGARTLAGNDNEWRYISIRRLFIMVEESVKKSTEAFVFEPNDANTWVKVQSMIENYLTTLWRAGALQGSKPEHAFYVSVGLGKTMTPQDILEGRMYVEIGMAAVRPAEFIVLRFSHMMAAGA